MSRARILVVDDKESFRALFRRIAPPDLEVVGAADGARALELLGAERFDVVVSDVRMPGLDGLSLLKRIRDAGLDVEVVLMTAYGTIADAVRAMKYGAADYLTKPFDPDDAVAAIEQALARRATRQPSRTDAPLPTLEGRSTSMKPVFEFIERASTVEANVLISGESGTGKELVARTVHAKSARSAASIVSVNCSFLQLPDRHGRLSVQSGASFLGDAEEDGRFDEAVGGTLFLDEIAELPGSMQAKLIQVLTGPGIGRVGASEATNSDVRVIAATSVDLGRAVHEGRFREDLYLFLNVLSIHLPPLRDRSGDVSLLADRFLERTMNSPRRAHRLSSEARAALEAYEWPGNVRQLENVIARVAAVATGEEIGLEALPAEIRNAPAGSAALSPAMAALPYREAIAVQRERATRDYIVAVLREVRGNVTQAAERAGIERESFHRLMKRHGVRAEDFRDK